MVDLNSVADEKCYSCGSGVDIDSLLVCDYCSQKVCHLKCLKPKLKHIPDPDWYCDYCIVKYGIKSLLPRAVNFAEQSNYTNKKSINQAKIQSRTVLPKRPFGIFTKDKSQSKEDRNTRMISRRGALEKKTNTEKKSIGALVEHKKQSDKTNNQLYSIILPSNSIEGSELLKHDFNSPQEIMGKDHGVEEEKQPATLEPDIEKIIEYVKPQPEWKEITHYIDGTFCGESKNGEPHGYGVFTWEDGAHYTGEWKCGLQDGFGVLLYPNGDSFIGDWRDGRRNGGGAEYYQNGDKYKSQWLNGKAEGKGEYLFIDGDREVIFSIAGVDQTDYIYHFANGDRREGDYISGRLHGKAIYYHNNGRVNREFWMNGNMVNEGRLILL
jgi:hypothetical protein